MIDAKPKYANFPERDLKVLIGANISATTTKTLTRLSIGTYEMSFTQQEKGTATAEAVRHAMNSIGRALGMAVTGESSRDFVATYIAQNSELRYQVWVTTPFELTQAGHILWAKFSEVSGDQKVGVAFKLATSFTVDDVSNLTKTAQKNAVKLQPGEAYTLKGNPPPRFTKKVVAVPVEAVAETTAAPVEPAP